MKQRIAILLLCLAVCVFWSGCAQDEATPETQAQRVAIGNPWSDWATLAEAEAAAGFSFDLPEVVADTYTAEAFRTLNNELIEVIYRDDTLEVRVRKAAGEGQDISGDYNTYDTCTETPTQAGTLVIWSDSAGGVKQLISCAGYSWSVTAPDGFWGDSGADFANLILGE